jgi:hypothetical protein
METETEKKAGIVIDAGLLRYGRNIALWFY